MRLTARQQNKSLTGVGHEYECVLISDGGTLGEFKCKHCGCEMAGTIIDDDKNNNNEHNRVVIYVPLHYRRKGKFEWISRETPCPFNASNLRVPPQFRVADSVRGPSLSEDIVRDWLLTVVDDTGTYAIGHSDKIIHALDLRQCSLIQRGTSEEALKIIMEDKS